MRVALLTNILAPYRLPAFRALGATAGWRLRIFVNAEREFDRSWEIDAGELDVETLPGLASVRDGRTLHVPSPCGLWRGLDRFAPDAVISAELGARSLFAWLWCARRRRPLVIWAEPTRARLAAAGPLRRHLGPFLLRRARAVVVPGSEGRRALHCWGVPDARVVEAPNAHDGETLAKVLAGLDATSVARLVRAGLGCRENVALVVGRLLPVKGIEELLVAWQQLAPALRRDWTLLFVGDGPLAEAIARARAQAAPGEIVRVPEVQPRELVGYYASADLLVFPSRGDVWGFAVNEAMAAGLPVVCSSRAGCAPDLVEPGRNGWLADPLDTDAFAAALGEALASRELPVLGARARETAAAFHPEAMAEGFREALRRAAPRRASAD